MQHRSISPPATYPNHLEREVSHTPPGTLNSYTAHIHLGHRENFMQVLPEIQNKLSFSPSAGHRTQLLLTLSPTFRTRSTTTKQPPPHKSHSQAHGRDPLTREGLPTLIPSLRRTPMTGGAPPHTPTQGELPLIRRGSSPQPPSHKNFCYRPAPTLPPKRTKIS